MRVKRIHISTTPLPLPNHPSWSTRRFDRTIHVSSWNISSSRLRDSRNHRSRAYQKKKNYPPPLQEHPFQCGKHKNTLLPLDSNAVDPINTRYGLHAAKLRHSFKDGKVVGHTKPAKRKVLHMQWGGELPFA